MVEFKITGGGCAANAAIAVARLGGAARFAGPLGDDEHSARILEGLAREGVDVAGIVRLPGTESSVSGIFVDAAGERLLATRRSPGLGSTRPSDPGGVLHGVEVVLADNHFPAFVAPICEAARARGIPVVLDIDKPVDICDPLMPLVSHPIFSAEALRAGTGIDDLPRALAAAGKHCPGFVAVTDGNNGAYWCADATHNPEVRHQPALRSMPPIRSQATGDVSSRRVCPGPGGGPARASAAIGSPVLPPRSSAPASAASSARPRARKLERLLMSGEPRVSG